jgi:hypothetical protein
MGWRTVGLLLMRAGCVGGGTLVLVVMGLRSVVLCLMDVECVGATTARARVYASTASIEPPGCDGKLHSGAMLDDCGVCNGPGGCLGLRIVLPLTM